MIFELARAQSGSDLTIERSTVAPLIVDGPEVPGWVASSEGRLDVQFAFARTGIEPGIGTNGETGSRLDRVELVVSGVDAICKDQHALI